MDNNDHATRMIESRIKNAANEAAELTAIVGRDEPGNDWEWHMDKLVHRQTTVLLLQIALDNGMEHASARAMSLVLAHVSSPAGGDGFTNAIRASKARAAADAIDLLQIVGLNPQRVGDLFLRNTR